MKKAIIIVLLLSPVLFLNSILAQPQDPSNSSECETFGKIMKDAYMHFTGYEGPEVTEYTVLGSIKVPSYELSLWGSTKGVVKEHGAGIGRMLFLDYYYGDSKSTATSKFNELNSNIQRCLSGDMYLKEKKEKDGGDITYYYENKADKDEWLPSYPFIMVKFIDYDDSYGVEIQINSMAGGK